MEDFYRKYGSIINMPHHISKKRPRMSMCDRAAQFAPFSALTGYGEIISETARIVDKKRELDESEKDLLDYKLSYIASNMYDLPLVGITYFKADGKKCGGAYITVNEQICRIDSYRRCIKLSGGAEIPFDDIYSIDFDLI